MLFDDCESLNWYTCVMDHESYAHDWLVAAQGAGFLPFEVVQPAPSSSSSAGFGGGSSGRLHCDIAHIIGGDEIFIGTTIGEDPSVDNDSETRRTILSGIESLLEGGVALPFTLHLTFEERTVDILVDGVPVTFRGIVGSGLDEWLLRADIDPGTTVSIQGRTGSSAPTAIRRRPDLRINGLPASS